MKKPVLGLVLGGLLGVFDGLTALFTPEAAPQIVGIVIGSTIKGLVVGALVGWFATRVNSLAAGLGMGLLAGAFFAFLVAAMPDPSGKHYYLEIILPGSLVGLIVGYATQRYGKAGAPKPVRAQRSASVTSPFTAPRPAATGAPRTRRATQLSRRRLGPGPRSHR